MKWLQVCLLGLGMLLMSTPVEAAKEDGRIKVLVVPTGSRVGLHVLVPQVKVAGRDATSISVRREVPGEKPVAVGTAPLRANGGLFTAWREDPDWYPEDPCQYTVSLCDSDDRPIGDAMSVSYTPGRVQQIVAAVQSTETKSRRLAWKIDPADIRIVESFYVIRTSGDGSAVGSPKVLPATARVYVEDAAGETRPSATVVYAMVKQPGSAARWLVDPDAPPVPTGLKAQWSCEKVDGDRYQALIKLAWDRKAPGDRRTATYWLFSDGGTGKHLDRQTEVASITSNEFSWEIDNPADLTYRVGIAAVSPDGRVSRPAAVAVAAPGMRMPKVEIATSQFDESAKAVVIKWAYTSPSHLAGFRIQRPEAKVLADPKQVPADARSLVYKDASAGDVEGLTITAVSRHGMESAAAPLKVLPPIPASEGGSVQAEKGGMPKPEGSTPASMEQLAQRVADGDADALGEMEKAIGAVDDDPALKQDQERRGARIHNLAMAAVNRLAAEATGGKAAAFAGLKELLKRKGHLASYVPEGLGAVAASGNDEALQMLIDTEANGILHSSAVSAMRLPAGKENLRAIRFLAGVLNDPGMKPTWNMAASGLKEPARKGNTEAIRALERYRAGESR